MNQKGNILSLLLIVILLAGIGAGVYLSQKQQIFKPRAVGGFSPAVGFVDASGNPIHDTTEANVILELTLDSTGANLVNLLPTGDEDFDGDPNSSDCGPYDPDAKHGQEGYFDRPYADQNGNSSYDYDCDGTDTPNPSKVYITKGPEVNRYTRSVGSNQCNPGPFPLNECGPSTNPSCGEVAYACISLLPVPPGQTNPTLEQSGNFLDSACTQRLSQYAGQAGWVSCN